eukprot:TRINITY_DN1024_c0_g1_i1.p1 TRINITY_DN1024_c0_g1~~TRINITY_DN1024_c0_g1_i1.p1  ORF type:complete len:194 (-),score=42.30 TRINITY_DN1024_c0_g1_i1:812-1393(-)
MKLAKQLADGIKMVQNLRNNRIEGEDRNSEKTNKPIPSLEDIQKVPQQSYAIERVEAMQPRLIPEDYALAVSNNEARNGLIQGRSEPVRNQNGRGDYPNFMDWLQKEGPEMEPQFEQGERGVVIQGGHDIAREEAPMQSPPNFLSNEEETQRQTGEQIPFDEFMRSPPPGPLLSRQASSRLEGPTGWSFSPLL